MTTILAPDDVMTKAPKPIEDTDNTRKPEVKVSRDHLAPLIAAALRGEARP